MGVVKEMWIADHEQAAEDFEMGVIGEEEFTAKMKALGFDAEEIFEAIDAIKFMRGD